MLRKLALTFVTSVTLKIKVTAPKCIGFLRGIWGSHIVEGTLQVLLYLPRDSLVFFILRVGLESWGWKHLAAGQLPLLRWKLSNVSKSDNIINTWNVIIIKVASLCLIYQALLNESNIPLLASVRTKLVHLSMPFILVVVYTVQSARINNILE